MSTAKLRDKLVKRKKEIKQRSEGRAYVTFKEDETVRARVLPTKDPDEEFGVEVITFWLGPDSGGLVISPASFDGGKCAFNEFQLKNKKSKDPTLRKIAEKLSPKRKYLVPHLQYEDQLGKKLASDEPKLFLLTPGQYQALIDLYLEEEKGDFTDPKTGYDIKYSREGSGMKDTKYTTMDCKPTPLPKQFAKLTVDPKAMVKEILPSYDDTVDLLAEFRGTVDTSDGEDYDAPRKPGKKKVAGKKIVGKKISRKSSDA
jgi:hypothetical protein